MLCKLRLSEIAGLRLNEVIAAPEVKKPRLVATEMLPSMFPGIRIDLRIESLLSAPSLPASGI